MGKALGKAIRARRERLQMTQTELGQAVGKSLRTIGNWERGEHVPQNRIGPLEDALGLPAGRLQAIADEEAGEVVTPVTPAVNDVLTSLQDGRYSRDELEALLRGISDLADDARRKDGG